MKVKKMTVFGCLAAGLALLPAAANADIVTYDWIPDTGFGVPGTPATGSLTYDTTTHAITSFSFVTPYASFDLSGLDVSETFYSQYTSDAQFKNYWTWFGLNFPIGVANPFNVGGGYTSGNDTGIPDYFLVLTGTATSNPFDSQNPNDTIYWSLYQNLFGQHYYAKNQGSSADDINYYGWWVLQPNTPSPVPEANTIIAGALLLLPLGWSVIRMIRKTRAV